MKQATRERAGVLFGALANPTRLRIVEFLADGEKTVNQIATQLAASQSGVSQHLAILTRAGVLMVEQRGVSRYYRIRGPRILRILELIEQFCEVHALYGDVDKEMDTDNEEY